jgi:HSP20 family protein
MLTLWNPLFPLSNKSDSKISMKSYFDRLFEDTFDADIQDVLLTKLNLGISQKKNEDGTLSLSVDVPGVKESDLTIEVSDNTLNIKGERKTNTSTYSIRKSFTIPEGYDSNEIVADLKDGVLCLTLNSKPPPLKEVRKIPIKSSK